MSTWALANQKGGTGKTTTAINVSAALAARGKRVLLLDLDPQAHATLGLGISVDDGRTIAETFLEEVSLLDLVRIAPGGFHMVPSALRLAEFEERASFGMHSERLLQAALRDVEAHYDWVLLDCPPRADGILTANAMRAADTTLLVVETGAFGLQGAVQARRIFEALGGGTDPGPRLKLVASMFDREQGFAREFLVAMQRRFGALMMNTVLRRDARLRESAAYGVPVRLLDPLAGATQDFDALATELLSSAATEPASAVPEASSPFALPL